MEVNVNHFCQYTVGQIPNINLDFVFYLRQGHNDQEWTIDFFPFHQISNQSNGLNGLPETHFIGQDSIQMVVIQGHQPFQSFYLQK